MITVSCLQGGVELGEFQIADSTPTPDVGELIIFANDRGTVYHANVLHRTFAFITPSGQPTKDLRLIYMCEVTRSYNPADEVDAMVRRAIES